MWLVVLAMILGMAIGEAAEAGTNADHHSGWSPGMDADFGKGKAPAPICHPGLTCTGFVSAEVDLTTSVPLFVTILQPVEPQAQRRFGGPSVSLPPPRSLT